MTNKIGWCSQTWNPVWGCRNKCPYCYARRIAGFRYDQIAEKEYQYMQNNNGIYHSEFANRLRHFVPIFIESNFAKKFPQKTQKIFVGSMSEIYYWREEWMERVIEKIKQYPQHIFMFLTKHPEVYRRYTFPKNCWLGVTITDNKYNSFEYHKFRISNPYNLIFVCFEPLLESKYTISINLEFIDWVILGAESGNRKGKVLPGLDPVLSIFRYCQKKKIPIYVKDNLGRPDVPFDFCRGYKQFPIGR